MRARPTARLFADLTMALEDMHRHAVDGQARDLAPDAAQRRRQMLDGFRIRRTAMRSAKWRPIQ